MAHEHDGIEINISDTELSFEGIYKKAYFPKNYEEEIRRANLLLVPSESFKGELCLNFPETTLEFLQYLKDNANEEVVPDIAVGDDDFQSLELHSAVVVVTTFIVSSIIFPVAINMVSSYLYDLAKRYHRSDDDMQAELNIIVEENGRSKKVSYKGPASKVRTVLNSSIPEMFSGDNNNDIE